MSFQDKICLPELHFTARHGVLAVEQEKPQNFTLSLTVIYDCSRAGATDDLTAALDYRRLYAIAAAVMLGEPQQLLETLATEIARRVLHELPVAAVTVRLQKDAADFGSVQTPAVIELSRQAGEL